MDIVETRRENLRRWIAEHGTPAKERSLFSQLKTDGSFGERVARRIEEQYRMGQGYLDQGVDMPAVVQSQPLHPESSNHADQAEELLRRVIEMIETYRLASPAARERIDRVVRQVRRDLGTVDKAQPSTR